MLQRKYLLDKDQLGHKMIKRIVISTILFSSFFERFKNMRMDKTIQL